ncbi:MAG: DUF4199 domain-containing protein [Bacteroidales bacterium]|nr:DUF4199 domain-containing protein [Bacteroidales bacterium]
MEYNRQTSPEGKVKNIYARGADDGAWMGLCLVALGGCMAGAMHTALLSVPAFALMAAVPVLTWFFLRRTHIAAHGMTVFSALWMQGITMFGCGALIFGLAAFVYLKWVDPDFIATVLSTAAGYYENIDDPTGNAAELADELEAIVKNHAVPSSGSVVLSWMWLIVFSGSLLSMVVAAVVKLRGVGATRRN